MSEPGTAPAAPGCPAVSSRTLFRTVEYPSLPILLEKIATKTGKGGFYKLADCGLNGAFQLDSAWPHGWDTADSPLFTAGARGIGEVVVCGGVPEAEAEG